MSNITPTKPSFVFGYWRPWKENSNLFDSYLDYAKDVSLVKYGADTVGKYINQASQEQVQAINQLGQAIGRGMNVLSNQMSDINKSLIFLNRNIDIQIEQQKLGNLLLQNIAELLRVPDSEKERQHCIELGIKFFVNASKDEDLFSDALEQLLKAESLMKQDYFVLHRIGCIYLYVEKYINPEKALDYFNRASKYALVESDSKAARLANVLTNNFKTVNSDLNNSGKTIGLLAADSFEKAAFAAYVLGRFSDAVIYQSKALKFNDNTKNRFLLAKYQVRSGETTDGVNNLDKCVDDDPVYSVATFKEIDLINEPEVLHLLKGKNLAINEKIDILIKKLKNLESTEAVSIVKELIDLKEKSYEIKVSKYIFFETRTTEINNKIEITELEINSYIEVVNTTTFLTLSVTETYAIIDDLKSAKSLPLEKIKEVIQKVKEKVEADKLKIGSYYHGGIVFYIDNTGKHGLVCADKDFGETLWGGRGRIGANKNEIGNDAAKFNTKLILDEASWSISKGFFNTSKKPVSTAARICIESEYNGFNDWYLPTLKELQLINDNLNRTNKGNFKLTNYWSSIESSAEFAWGVDFNTGKAKDSLEKGIVCCVRAIRAF
jgi:tetratricopeptide (TPR) repeat protein